MAKTTDARPVGCGVYFLPVETRVPLKFGTETLTHVVCARVRLTVADARGQTAEGWGETPLSVQWVWPSTLPYGERYAAMETLCRKLAKAWASFDTSGHPIEVGHAFLESALPALLAQVNAERGSENEPMPWLAALVCCSAFDIALHDAYGVLHQCPVYHTYGPPFMNRDLAAFLAPATGSAVTFAGKYPRDFLILPPPGELAAWHLVGGLDPLESADLDGSEPKDGYP
ncbi:MAG: hypothetical protein QHJ73_17730, partial [Armatimonadota bacterium]|nr:hypothetical protein [Armatimonadota bacterium]